MSTLIIPCVGRKIVNGIPQYLNRHPNGKLLIERSIEGVFSDKYRRILIVLLKEDAKHFDALCKSCDFISDWLFWTSLPIR